MQTIYWSHRTALIGNALNPRERLALRTWVRISGQQAATRPGVFAHRIMPKRMGKRSLRARRRYFDFTVDKGKGRQNRSREKNEDQQHLRMFFKVEKTKNTTACGLSSSVTPGDMYAQKNTRVGRGVKPTGQNEGRHIFTPNNAVVACFFLSISRPTGGRIGESGKSSGRPLLFSPMHRSSAAAGLLPPSFTFRPQYHQQNGSFDASPQGHHSPIFFRSLYRSRACEMPPHAHGCSGFPTKVFNIGDYRRRLGYGGVAKSFFEKGNEEGQRVRSQMVQVTYFCFFCWHMLYFGWGLVGSGVGGGRPHDLHRFCR